MANTDPNYACGTYGAGTYNGCDEVATPTPTAKAQTSAQTGSDGMVAAPEATVTPSPTTSPALSPSPAYTVAPVDHPTPADAGSSNATVLGWAIGGLMLLALLVGLGLWLWRRRRQAEAVSGAVPAPALTLPDRPDGPPVDNLTDH